MNARFVRLSCVIAGLLSALGAWADEPTWDWQLPLPPAQGWRITDLREGKGIRHEEYVPRGQGIDDYRDRLLVQRFTAQDMTPEAYLSHIAAGMAKHCPAFTTSGLVSGVRDGMPHATRSAYCGRFDERPYGYVIAQKAIRDHDHLFVVEREWRLTPFAVDADGSITFSETPGEDEALKREIHSAVRWLTEQVNPGSPPPAAPAPPATRKRR